MTSNEISGQEKIFVPKFENFDKWIEDKYDSKTGLAEKLGVSKNTVSLWCLGKSQIKGRWEKKIRSLGYDGPLPKPAEPVTAEDLQGLGRDLVLVVNESENRLSEEIRSSGAVLQEIQARLEQLLKIHEASR